MLYGTPPQYYTQYIGFGEGSAHNAHKGLVLLLKQPLLVIGTKITLQ